MSETFKAFLITLGEDPDTLERFKQDPNMVMEDHGLSEEEKALLLEGDKVKLQQAGGLDDDQTNALIV